MDSFQEGHDRHRRLVAEQGKKSIVDQSQREPVPLDTLGKKVFAGIATVLFVAFVIFAIYYDSLP
ncbi:hypothetical protein [Nonomuraea rubra]|jgi:hypothetical protein|uniref:Uncharacterized protein n=1 Tax=Nonomuraea rubra TaxID=46180 RepID=A0A7X0P8Q3_9ACTN|nr:hypothetical protein [Nonomuraea rubra]MBB6557335.1 hypothetical protein [Nonomuraea rubra]